jgi:hypothetical protein
LFLSQWSASTPYLIVQFSFQYYCVHPLHNILVRNGRTRCRARTRHNSILVLRTTGRNCCCVESPYPVFHRRNTLIACAVPPHSSEMPMRRQCTRNYVCSCQAVVPRIAHSLETSRRRRKVEQPTPGAVFAVLRLRRAKHQQQQQQQLSTAWHQRAFRFPLLV